MAASLRLVGLRVLALGATASASPLSIALQHELDRLFHAKPEVLLQVGWKSAAEEFGVASGTVRMGASVRSITPDDKFLFGSGTKPLVASAVMRLVAQQKLSLDDRARTYVDPYLKRHLNGNTMESLFGPMAANITVGHLLRMQSGLADFDSPALDARILAAGFVITPYDFIGAASGLGPSLLFAPGTHRAYSSTNYVLAGLVLLGFDPDARGDWRRLDQRHLVGMTASRWSNVSFVTDEPLDSVLTVPGASGMGTVKPTNASSHVLVWRQLGGILGWTCGNMAASAADVAAYYHELLASKKIVPPTLLDEMEDFGVLDEGPWGVGVIKYGTGLMIENVAGTEVPPGTNATPPSLQAWGSYLGHGGDTYGFLSEQGIIPQLGNASFSVVTNQDYLDGYVYRVACVVVATAARVLRGVEPPLDCHEPPDGQSGAVTGVGDVPVV